MKSKLYQENIKEWHDSSKIFFPSQDPNKTVLCICSIGDMTPTKRLEEYQKEVC